MTANANINEAKKSNRLKIGRLIWVSLGLMILTGAANLGIFFAIGYFFPQVTAWAGAGILQITGANNFYLTLGAIVVVLNKRYSSRPATHFQIIATLGLIFSFGLPIGAFFGYGLPPNTPAADLVTVLSLSLMHIASFAISVPVFSRLIKE